MSFRIIIHPDMASTCRKLRSKSPERYEQLMRKIRFLVENPQSGKPLHPPLKGLWRVHLGHYVLIYAIDAKENAIVFLKFVNHDEAYKYFFWRFMRHVLSGLDEVRQNQTLRNNFASGYGDPSGLFERGACENFFFGTLRQKFFSGIWLAERCVVYEERGSKKQGFLRSPPFTVEKNPPPLAKGSYGSPCNGARSGPGCTSFASPPVFAEAIIRKNTVILLEQIALLRRERRGNR